MNAKDRAKIARAVESAAYDSLDVADTSDPLTLARAVTNGVMAALALYDKLGAEFESDAAEPARGNN